MRLKTCPAIAGLRQHAQSGQMVRLLTKLLTRNLAALFSRTVPDLQVSLASLFGGLGSELLLRMKAKATVAMEHAAWSIDRVGVTVKLMLSMSIGVFVFAYTCLSARAHYFNRLQPLLARTRTASKIMRTSA